MTDLTKRQIQILRWLDENPSTRARWLVNGRNPKGREGADPEKWTHMEVSGPNGAILIAAADNKVLYDYITDCPAPDKIYGPSELGKSAIGNP